MREEYDSGFEKSENTSRVEGWGSVFLNLHRRCRQTSAVLLIKWGNRQMVMEPETESQTRDNRLSIWYTLTINA